MKVSRRMAIVIVINLIALLSYLAVRNPSKPSLNAESLVKLTSYVLPAKNNTPIITNNVLEYPYVKTKPGRLKYFITALRDQSTDKLYHKGGLYFAAKRISELIKWGDELPINGNINDIHELEEWWAGTKPSWWQFYKYGAYDSWEATLARYDSFIRYELADVITNTSGNERDKRLGALLSNFDLQNRTLISVIAGLNLPPSDKFYLNFLRIGITSELNREINNYVDSGRTDMAEIPLTPIITAQDYGRFDGYLNVQSIPAYIADSLYVTSGKQKVYPKKITRYGDPLLVFNDIAINQKSQVLELHYERKNFIQRDELNPTKKGNMVFYQLKTEPIATDQAELEHLFQVSYPLSQKAYLEFDETNVSSMQGTENAVINDLLLPIKGSTDYVKHVHANPGVGFTIRIITEKPFTTEELAKIKLDLAPLYRPDMKFIKTAFLSAEIPHIKLETNNSHSMALLTEHLTESDKQYLTQLFGFGWRTDIAGDVIRAEYRLDKELLTIVILSLILSLVIIFASNNQPIASLYSKYKIIAKQLWHLVLAIPHKFIKRFETIVKKTNTVKTRTRFIFFGFVCVVSAIDIFFVQAQHENIYWIVLALWLTIGVFFRPISRNILWLALIYFAISAVGRLFVQVPFANKAAIWVFTFLFLALCFQLFETEKPSS